MPSSWRSDACSSSIGASPACAGASRAEPLIFALCTSRTRLSALPLPSRLTTTVSTITPMMSSITAAPRMALPIFVCR